MTAPVSHRESDDTYIGVLARLSPDYRVIVCKDGIQWILQRSKKAGLERRWRGVGYFTTKKALIRVSATCCDRIDPVAQVILDTLPKHVRKVGQHD